MAYIVNFLIALIYIVPSAIFFWLSKDVVVTLAKKLMGLITSIISSLRNKEKLPAESDPAEETPTDAGTAEDDAAITEDDAAIAEDTLTAEDDVAIAEDDSAIAEDATTAEDAITVEGVPTAEDAATEESVAEAQEPEVLIADRGVANERFGEQMTIEEAVSAVTASDIPAPEQPITEEPESGDQAPDKTAQEDSSEEETDITQPAPETMIPVEPASQDEAAEEPSPEAPVQDELVPEETAKEEDSSDESSPEESAPEDPALAETTSDGQALDEATIDESPESDEAPAKEPSSFISGMKSGFTSAAQKVKQIAPVAPFKNLIDKTKQKSDETPEKPQDGESKKGGVFNQLASQLKPRKDSADDDFIETSDIGDGSGTIEDLDIIGENDTIEDQVKRQFDNLDMITTSAIAIMLSDTKSKTTSPYIKNVKKPDIRVILLKFCKDTFFATDIEQINSLFSKSYYKRKIYRYLSRLTVFIKRGIGDSLPKRVAFRKARVTRNRFINKICETLSTFESVKYISALSGNEEVSDSKRNYKLDHLSENYKDALIYLVDILLTCTCITKMLFVERMIRKMDPNSEFNKIITNMANSIDNHNLIINKSRPIYKQYYQAELGYINGDELLYGLAITIMVNRVKKVEIGNTDILQLSDGPLSAREFSSGMLKWLDALSIDEDVEDIGTLILQKINLSIKDNYSLLTSALQELTNWEDYYYKRVAYYKKARDRERYLIGDFEAEKKELRK